MAASKQPKVVKIERVPKGSRIQTITFDDGKKKYRIVVDVGYQPKTDPESGRPVINPDGKPVLRRKQKTFTFPTKKQAEAELLRIGHQRREGTYVEPSKITLNAMLDSWLASAGFEREEATRSNYSHALRVPREQLGERLAQSITREDVERLRDFMLTGARKRGGKAGTGLGARSVRLAIGRLSAAFMQAVDDGRVVRNPCRGVRLPTVTESTTPSWSADEAKQFLAAASSDRLYAAWLLAACGLRREEICGLRWSDVDDTTGTFRVAVVRFLVDSRVDDKDRPKSPRSVRTLPMLPGMPAAFTALHAQQAREKLAAGAHYADSGFVVVDELGRPVNPGHLSKVAFQRIRAGAGLRRITLHELRATANTLMELAGVPDSIRAAYLGHAVDVNRAVYLRPNPADLAVGSATLGSVYGLAGE